MTGVTLAAAVVDSPPFPAGTTDVPYDYTVTGTLADGTTPFALAQASGAFDLQPGTYTGVVTKTVGGSTFSSMPSLPLTLTAPATVTLKVPDGSQAALLTSP